MILDSGRWNQQKFSLLIPGTHALLVQKVKDTVDCSFKSYTYQLVDSLLFF